ncbi:MAG: response regulator [Nitrospirae bacterium]|nr:response regulator [Nitrospirota bacterium]
MMPKINGIELTKMVRNLNLSLPIIGMSATGDEREFLAAGADLFMAKPFIFSAIENVLKGKFFIENP